jgi:CHAT domain-containing protein
MPRSSRRRRLTALLLLLWQWAVLSPGAVAAQQLPAGESQSVAQAAMPAAKGIPAEVVQWFDAMKEAADKGDGAKALQMHQKVLAWVQANLPEKHVFRARVLVRYGYVLDKIGRFQDALIPAQDGAEMLRELVRINPDQDNRYFLAIALYNLGRRHSRLQQKQQAISFFQEAIQCLSGFSKTSKDGQKLEPDFLIELASTYRDIGQLESALAKYREALGSAQGLAKEDITYKEYIAILQFAIGSMQKRLRQFKEAEVSLQESLPLLRENIKTGTDLRFQLATAHLLLGDIYQERLKLELASEAYQDALRIYQKLPKTDRSMKIPTVDVRVSLAEVYTKMGQLSKAQEVYHELLPLLQEEAKRDPGRGELLAKTTFAAADIHDKLGSKQKSLSDLQASLSVLRKISAAKPEIALHQALILISLSSRYAEYAEWTPALSLSQEATAVLRTLPKTDESEAMIGMALASEGASYNALGKFRQSLAPSEEAVRKLSEIRLNSPGLDSARVTYLAVVLGTLGNSNLKLGRFSEAIAASSNAIQILKRLPTTHPKLLPLLRSMLLDVGISYYFSNNLESSLISLQEAIALLSEAAKISPLGNEDRTRLALSKVFAGFIQVLLSPGEQMLGPMTEAVQSSRELSKAGSLGTELLGLALFVQGLQYSILGRRQEALGATRESISIRKTQAMTDPRMLYLYVTCLIVEGFHYSNLGRPHEALAPGLEAVRLSRKLVAENPEWRDSYALSLLLAGYHYGKLGQDQDVLSTAGESLKIYRELAGKDSKYKASAASALILIGQASARQGKWQLSLSRSREAIALLRATADSNFEDRSALALALKDHAQALVNLSQDNQALASAQEAVEIDRSLAKAGFDALQQLSESSTTLGTISLRQGQSSAAIPLLREAVSSEVRFLQQQLPLMPEGRRQALVDTLGRRWELPYSLALQGEAGASLALYTRLNRHGPLQDIERRQAMISRSSGATQALVNRLSILNSQISNPTITAKARQNALAEAERLQEDLFRQLPALQSRLVEIAEVARQVPPDGVLVEFQRFSPYNAAKPEKDAWGKPRYLALLLDQRGTPRAVDLGEADAVDRAIATALDRTRFQQPEADRAWALVAETLFFPLRGSLEGKRQLLLSPDGQLHRVPFGALALLAGSTPSLPATLTLHTIGNGRDLVTSSNQLPPATASLVLADPATTGWSPLVRAASEGQTVAASLSGKLLLGQAASVAELERARGPRILHVAGHGYFDPRAKGDPLLASGLALAGADKARQPSRQSNPQPSAPSSAPNPQPTTPSPAPSGMPSDDGYLTAKEAARLQLDGTQLVVLSACESGLGSERSGEGLFGLRRALTVAGARGTLLSLWKVPEHATETFMTRFYTLLGQGIPPGQAVRRVQAEFRADPRIDGWSDPFYWAGWQYSGLPDLPR